MSPARRVQIQISVSMLADAGKFTKAFLFISYTNLLVLLDHHSGEPDLAAKSHQGHQEAKASDEQLELAELHSWSQTASRASESCPILGPTRGSIPSNRD